MGFLLFEAEAQSRFPPVAQHAMTLVAATCKALFSLADLVAAELRLRTVVFCFFM
jgi:hypothetical protein